MKPITKQMIKTFLFSGLFFAGITAAWDYYDGNSFRLTKFVFNATFFGLAMAYSTRNSLKKESVENNKQELEN